MILIELASQGVRGVAPAGGRMTLRPGYNVVAAEGAALRRLVEALLLPEPGDGETLPRAGGAAGAAPLRAGVTLVGNDQVTYRLVRDFSAGCQLHRFDPQKRAFAPVSQDLADIGRHLREEIGVPSRARLDLLGFSASELPSKQATASLGMSASALAPPRPALTSEQKDKRLADLRVELERSRSAEKLQYQLDGLQSRLFKLEEALREGGKIREGLEAAKASLAKLEPQAEVVAGLGDLDARLAAQEKATAKRDEGLARAAEERTAIEEVEARGAPMPFWRDARFWAGAGVGLAAVAAGVAGSGGGGGLRYLALLDLPAFGWAAWVALRWVGVLEDRSRLGRRRRVVEERERKVVEQYERETAELRSAMRALGTPGISELKEIVGRMAGARQSDAEWRARLEAFESQPETRNAQEERARVEMEMRDVESRLAGEAGGFIRDPRSVEMEIQRLEAEAVAAAAEPGTLAPAAPAGPAADPIAALLGRAASELGGSPSAAARSLQPRAVKMLAALSGQRLGGLSVDDRGNLSVGSGGRAGPVAALTPPDRDLCFLALKLALVETLLGPGKLLALADDAFASLPEVSRRAAARLMKQVARTGQLLHATPDVVFREAADHLA